MKVIQKKISELIFADYNPRQLFKKEYKHLKESIGKFGLVDPIIINKNKDRENVIIGGHQRVKIAKELKIKDIPCVEVDLELERERELNIRLNKNTGSWDYDILANMFEVDELVEWGFDEKEFNVMLDLPETEEPEHEISAELLEEHNYVLFYFDNSLDWNVAKDLLDIKPVVKEGYTDTYKQIGVGRVKDGKELLKRLSK